MLIEWFGLVFWKAPTYSYLPRTQLVSKVREEAGIPGRPPGGTQAIGLENCPARVRTSASGDSRPDPECCFGLATLKHQANETRRISELNYIHARGWTVTQQDAGLL